MKSSSTSKMTPRSLMNQRKAVESRARHKGNATPNENKVPCGKQTPKTPISTTPNSTPRIRKHPPHRTVLFEFNENILVQGSSPGVNLRSRSKLDIKDSTPVLSRSRSANNIKWEGDSPAVKRSLSVANVNDAHDFEDKGTRLSPAEIDSPGESSRITVGVRIRPLNSREYGNALVVEGQQLRVASDILSELGFTFDHVFVSTGEEPASQQIVYESMLKPLLKNAFMGHNACLFAYGQTGSGKTYSMMGPEAVVDGISETTGIIPRFCKDLFERCNTSIIDTGNGESHTTTTVEISYLEVYNEKIRDLLVGSNQSRTIGGGLRVREHPVYGPYVADLSRHTVNCFDDIQHWLSEGNKRRVVAATDMNDTSSRSHSMFTLTLTQSTIQTTGNGVWSHERSKRSQINLVDLAGSERMAHSTSFDRLKEGVSINKSLLTLGKVITALVEKRSFVPYRESILTWLLKESLGGNSRTAMLATVSPCSNHTDETVATLRYASQARAIVNVVRVNESPQDKIIRELEAEVQRLKESFHALERGSSTKCTHVKKVEADEGKIAAVEAKWTALESEWKQKLSTAETEASRLNKENILVRENFEAMSADCDKWKAQALKFQTEMSEHMGKACQEQTSLHNQLVEWRDKVFQLEQQQMEWNESIQTLQNKLSAERSAAAIRLQEVQDDLEQKLSSITENYERKLSESKIKLTDTENNYSHKLNAVESQYNDKIAELESKLAEDSTHTVLKVTTAVQVQTSEALDRNELNETDKGPEMKKIKKEVIKLKKKLQDQFKLVDALKAKAERSTALERELEEVKLELNHIKSEANEKKEELEQLRANLADKESHLNQSVPVNDLALAKAEASSAKAELEQTKFKVEIAIKEAFEASSKSLAQLNKVQDQHESLKCELSNTQYSLTQSMIELSNSKAEVMRLTFELTSAKEREESLLAKLEETNSELELLKVLEQRYREKIDTSLQVDSDISAKSGPVFVSSYAQTDPSLHSSDQLQRRVAELQKRVDQKLCLIAELEKANSRYKEETSHVMEQLSDATGRISQAEAISRESHEKLTQLHSDYEAEVERSNGLAQKIEDLNAELNAAKDNLTKEQLNKLSLDAAEKEKNFADLSEKVNDILTCLKNKNDNQSENKENKPLDQFDLNEALSQVERKKKRIEKLKSRIDALELGIISVMRSVSNNNHHEAIRAEHAKIYNTMMEHSYLFHWEYLLRKARTFVHKYHIPYEFDGHDNVTVLVKHTLFQAKSYWFRIDIMSWFERIEKEDRWTRAMDKDIQWEVDFGSYYNVKESSPGSKCPIEGDRPEPYLDHVALCCKPDFICPQSWQKSIVKRHLSGLRDDCRCLLVYLRNSKSESVINILRCIDNMATDLKSELLTCTETENTSDSCPCETVSCPSQSKSSS